MTATLLESWEYTRWTAAGSASAGVLPKWGQGLNFGTAHSFNVELNKGPRGGPCAVLNGASGGSGGDIGISNELGLHYDGGGLQYPVCWGCNHYFNHFPPSGPLYTTTMEWHYHTTSSDNTGGYLGISRNGAIGIFTYDWVGGPTLVGNTADGLVSPGTWNYIEYWVKPRTDTSGEVRAYLNGSLVLQVTGIRTIDAITTNLNCIIMRNPSTDSTYESRFADIYAADDYAPNTVPWGPIQVGYFYPIGDGTYMEATGSEPSGLYPGRMYTAVDDRKDIQDGIWGTASGSTYVIGDESARFSFHTLPVLAPPTANIKCVMPLMMATQQNGSAGYRRMRTFLRHTSLGDAYADYRYFQSLFPAQGTEGLWNTNPNTGRNFLQIFDVDPWTGSAWTPAMVNGIWEVGMYPNSADGAFTSYITQIGFETTWPSYELATARSWAQVIGA